MMHLIYLSIIIVGLCLFYKYLSKFNFNLKGIEIIIYEGAFICLYSDIFKDIIFFRFISVILFAFWFFYYLLKAIKTQIYTKIGIILTYILLYFINALILSCITPAEASFGIGLSLHLLIFITINYILLMNLILFTIKQEKKRKSELIKQNKNNLAD